MGIGVPKVDNSAPAFFTDFGLSDGPPGNGQKKDSVVITTASHIRWLLQVQLQSSPQKDLAKVNVTAPNLFVKDWVFKRERSKRDEVHIAMYVNKTAENRNLTILLQQFWQDYYRADEEMKCDMKGIAIALK